MKLSADALAFVGMFVVSHLFCEHLVFVLGPFGLNFIGMYNSNRGVPLIATVLSFVVKFADPEAPPSASLFGGDMFGIYAVLIMFGCQIIASFFQHNHFHICIRYRANTADYVMQPLHAHRRVFL